MNRYPDHLIERIWLSAHKEQGYDPSKWRKDFAGAWIRNDLYGTRQKYGWEIGHMIPISQGGTDAIENLQPIHWQNNLRKGDNVPVFNTIITSEGTENIEKEKKWQLQHR